MNKRLTTRVLAALVSIALCASSLSFWRQGSSGEVPGMAPEAKRAMIENLAKQFEAEYVFKDKAVEVAKLLRENLKQNGYDSVSSGLELANLLSKQVNDICRDAHFRVRYSASKLPERREVSEPSAEERQRQQRQTKLQNAGFASVQRLAGNIGYFKLNGFYAPAAVERPCAAAFDFLADTDALIIDMRDNGGGQPAAVQLVCSYLFDEKPVHLNSLYFRKGDRTIEFWTLPKVAGKRYLGRDVYVLMSRRTGSGGEEFCYNLQNLKRATLIGDRTWGGANPGGVYRLSDHFSAFIPEGRAINPYTKTNWEGTGVQPDIPIDPKNALEHANVLAVKNLLAKATDAEDKSRLAEVLRELGAG